MAMWLVALDGDEAFLRRMAGLGAGRDNFEVVEQGGGFFMRSVAVFDRLIDSRNVFREAEKRCPTLNRYQLGFIVQAEGPLFDFPRLRPTVVGEIVRVAADGTRATFQPLPPPPPPSADADGMQGPLIQWRVHQSRSHLFAAGLSAHRSSEKETAFRAADEVASIRGTLARRITADASAAIMASVAFIEALVNEVFEDAFVRFDREGSFVPVDSAERLALVWEQTQERRSFAQLEAVAPGARALIELIVRQSRGQSERPFSLRAKFRAALVATGGDPFVEDEQPWLDMNQLIELRHALVHYRPESVRGKFDWQTDTSRSYTLEQELQGTFPTHPAYLEGNTFFPQKVLGAGAARWAVETALSFADALYDRLGLRPQYAETRNEVRAMLDLEGDAACVSDSPVIG